MISAIDFEAENFNKKCLFKDELISEIRIISFKKGAELIINEVEHVRNQIYNEIPTWTNIDAFELLKIIKKSLEELDVILNMK